MKEKTIKDTMKYYHKKPKSLKNSIVAFISGGLLAVFAQFLKEAYMMLFALKNDDATSYVIVTIIFLSVLLTALHKYDKLAQICGAGLFIPISGFANALTSCAIDGKKEGFILGIGSNMFKLAGSVLTYGIVSAAILGFVRYLL